MLEKLAPKISPNPQRAAELRREFEKGFDETIMHGIWPNLSVISGIGTSTFTAFSNIARRYTEGNSPGCTLHLVNVQPRVLPLVAHHGAS